MEPIALVMIQLGFLARTGGAEIKPHEDPPLAADPTATDDCPPEITVETKIQVINPESSLPGQSSISDANEGQGDPAVELTLQKTNELELKFDTRTTGTHSLLIETMHHF